MATPEPQPARRAALLLHTLAPAARAAVLAQLSAAEAEQLRPLLEELAELRIPPALGRKLQQSDQAAAPPSLRERVRQLPAARVLRALDACADATVAQLLRAERWPWEKELLAAMAPRHRAAVLEQLERAVPVLAPAVVTCLCEELCRHAAADHKSMGAIRPKSQRRWFAWRR